MSDIQRYEYWHDIKSSSHISEYGHGTYVKYDDYTAEVEQLQLNLKISYQKIGGSEQENAKLQARIDELTDLLRRYRNHVGVCEGIWFLSSGRVDFSKCITQEEADFIDKLGKVNE